MQIILRIFSIIVFPILVISILWSLILSPSPSPVHYYLFWLLAVFSVINWICWKTAGGVISIIVTLAVTIYTSTLTGNGGFILVNIPILVLVFLLYLSEEHAKGLITNHNLNSDKQEREYNILLHEYKKQESLEKSYHLKSERFTRLSKIANNLGFKLAPEEIDRQIIDDLTQTIDEGDIYSLWEVGHDLQTLALKALESSGGIISPDSIKSDRFNQWMMRHRQPLLVTNVSKDYRFNTAEILSNSPTKSLIMAPLMTEDKIHGIVRIDSAEPDTFSIDDLRLIAIIANIATLTIHNAKLFKETEYLAERDGLTGIYTKQYFTENCEKSIASAKEKGVSFSILLFDLDKFKQLNDTYGHSIGDKVLTKVAKLIEESSGKNSITARYGGEEIVVLLPNSTIKEAAQTAEKIRKTIETEQFSVRRKGISTTISIGVAEFPTNGNSVNELIDKADKALYQAKHKGRNRVVTA